MAKKIRAEGKGLEDGKGSKDSKDNNDCNNKEWMVERAREILGRSVADEVHFTSDGTAFYQAEHAAIHSENLADNKIVTIKREEIE